MKQRNKNIILVETLTNTFLSIVLNFTFFQLFALAGWVDVSPFANLKLALTITALTTANRYFWRYVLYNNKKQSCLGSAIETGLLIGSGMVLAFCTTQVFDLLGLLIISVVKNAKITVALTVISIIRSYWLRRIFNRYFT